MQSPVPSSGTRDADPIQPGATDASEGACSRRPSKLTKSRKIEQIPNAPLRNLVQAHRRRDPQLTYRRIAREAGLSPSHMLRLLGCMATAPSARNARVYPGRLLESIEVGYAERIVRALGYAPHQLAELCGLDAQHDDPAGR